MATNKDLEDLAAASRVTLDLAHWDEEDRNRAWVEALRSAETFLGHIKHVAGQVGTQAQGKGLFLLTRPDQYSPKPGSANLMIVTCVNTPCLDITAEPKPDSRLYKQGFTNKAAVYTQEENGAPPKMLMKYGGYYRLTTIEGVAVTTSLDGVNPTTIEDWRTRLARLSDRSGYNAFKAQANKAGIDVTRW
jgi:hypothetical protein